MPSVYDKILHKIQSDRAGSIYTTRDFLHLANRTSVDKALSFLAQNNVLRRLAWGIYDRPIKDPKLGLLPPDLDAVIDTIQRQSGDTLQVDGAKAANMLGLSTQVPAQIVYLTDGHSRQIKIGHWLIQLKHASPKVLIGAGQMVGYVLQALRYLGKQNIDSKTAKKLGALLSPKEKKQLKQLIAYAPGWAHNTLQSVTQGI